MLGAGAFGLLGTGGLGALVAGAGADDDSPDGDNPGNLAGSSRVESSDTPDAGDSPGEMLDIPPPPYMSRPVGEALDAFAVGRPIEGVNPHRVAVVNDTSESRSLRLRIDAPVEEVRLLDLSYTLPADSFVIGALRKPRYYELRIDLPGREPYTTEVSHFDTCNEYGTQVIVQSDGTDVLQSGTTVACDSVPVETPA